MTDLPEHLADLLDQIARAVGGLRLTSLDLYHGARRLRDARLVSISTERVPVGDTTIRRATLLPEGARWLAGRAARRAQAPVVAPIQVRQLGLLGDD